MSFLDLSNVDISDKRDSSDFELLPEGKYLLRCSKAEVCDTKAGTGRYIKCQLKVETGDHENRVVFHTFNFDNPSAKAQEIGLAQLKKFLTFGGYFDPQNLKEVGHLDGLTSMAMVKIRKDEKWGDKNVISYFFEEKKEEKAPAGF